MRPLVYAQVGHRAHVAEREERSMALRRALSRRLLPISAKNPPRQIHLAHLLRRKIKIKRKRIVEVENPCGGAALSPPPLESTVSDSYTYVSLTC